MKIASRKTDTLSSIDSHSRSHLSACDYSTPFHGALRPSGHSPERRALSGRKDSRLERFPPTTKVPKVCLSAFRHSSAHLRPSRPKKGVRWLSGVHRELSTGSKHRRHWSEPIRKEIFDATIPVRQCPTKRRAIFISHSKGKLA